MLKYGKPVFAIDLAEPAGYTRENREQRKAQRAALKALGVPLRHPTKAAAEKALVRVLVGALPFEVRVFEQTPVYF